MIRCSECEWIDTMAFNTKEFYFCAKHRFSPGVSRVKKLWTKKPKGHPRWCPLWKGDKQSAEQGKH